MTETILKIDGMMCGMCENHVCDTIRNQFTVKKVSASHTKGIATIISPEPLDEEALRKAIAETGYELKMWSPSPTKSTASSTAKKA